MKNAILGFLVALLVGGAFAADAPSAGHPALWRVTGTHSTVYLFGSVHVLSPALAWRDARIDAAIRAADTFYFEAPLDQNAIRQFIETKGSLPAGQSLHTLLPPDAMKDFEDDLALLGVPEANFDTRRPWLVTVAMMGLKFAKANKAPPTGVDLQIVQEVQARGKPLRYFETLEQQVALLAPNDPKVELEAFEVFLKDFKTEDTEMDALTEAWMAGDQDRLATLLMKGFAQHPVARKALFDDRNKAWLKPLEDVLDKESGTFLVTVGAGHLVTERGVPALLRRAGYKVEEL